MLALKEIKTLQRDPKARLKLGLFIVEGIKMFRETPPDLIEQICLSESFEKEHGREVIARIGRERAAAISEIIPDSRMEKLSDTRSPQGVLLVVRQMKWEMEAVLNKEAPLILLLEDVQDPGNVGTILRTADAAGFDGVLLSPDCADVFSPKVLRATMGSIFRVGLAFPRDLPARLAELKSEGFSVLSSQLDGTPFYDRENVGPKLVLIVGNEGNGVSEAVRRVATHHLRLPMRGGAESLNAAIAAGIMMYDLMRT